MRKAEFTGVDLKSTNHCRIPILSAAATYTHTHTPLLFSVMHFKFNLFQMITSPFQEILHMEISKGLVAR